VCFLEGEAAVCCNDSDSRPNQELHTAETDPGLAEDQVQTDRRKEPTEASFPSPRNAKKIPGCHPLCKSFLKQASHGSQLRLGHSISGHSDVQPTVFCFPFLSPPFGSYKLNRTCQLSPRYITDRCHSVPLIRTVGWGLARTIITRLHASLCMYFDFVRCNYCTDHSVNLTVTAPSAMRSSWIMFASLVLSTAGKGNRMALLTNQLTPPSHPHRWAFA